MKNYWKYDYGKKYLQCCFLIFAFLKWLVYDFKCKKLDSIHSYKPRNLDFGLLTFDFFYGLRMIQGYQLDHSPLTITKTLKSKNVSLIIFFLNMLDSSVFSFLLSNFLCWAGRGVILSHFYSLGFVIWDLLHA